MIFTVSFLMTFSSLYLFFGYEFIIESILIAAFVSLVFEAKISKLVFLILKNINYQLLINKQEEFNRKIIIDYWVNQSKNETINKNKICKR